MVRSAEASDRGGLPFPHPFSFRLKVTQYKLDQISCGSVTKDTDTGEGRREDHEAISTTDTLSNSLSLVKM